MTCTFFFSLKNLSFKVDNLKLVPHGVFIVWDWEWSDSSSGDESAPEQNVALNHHLQSSSESESEEGKEQSELAAPLPTHAVTFKCIGSTHHPDAQEALARAVSMINKGEVVPVRMIKEPDNQYDSKAIAFQCLLDNKWIRIGYIVKEALDHVHKALDDNKSSMFVLIGLNILLHGAEVDQDFMLEYV